MPWRGPLGGDPLAKLPGPSNPWLVGEGGSEPGVTSLASSSEQVPDFASLDVDQLTLDWNKIGNGTRMVTCGLSIFAAAMAGGLAVGATLPFTATGSAESSVVAIVGSVLAGGGMLLAGAGVTTVLGGIDPRITDYKKHVGALPTRKLSLPADLAPCALRYMSAIAEIERLSTAEIDIIDHARAAAKAGDKSWTELHVRDLYHVENAKQHFLRSAADDLGDVNERYGSKLDDHYVDPRSNIRDLVNPVIEMRATLNEVASISSAEINAFLALLRIPSPLSTTLDEAVRALLNQANGQPSQILKAGAGALEGLDVVDHAAFEVKSLAQA